MASVIGPVRSAMADQALEARRKAKARIRELLTEFRQLTALVADCDAVCAALGIDAEEPLPDEVPSSPAPPRAIEIPEFERTASPVRLGGDRHGNGTGH